MVEFGLLGAHVFQRADHLAELGEQRPLGQLLAGGLGHAEIDHLGDRLAVVQGDQHVGRLDVAMDDPFLVGMLHRLADGDKQLQPLAEREVMLVAVSVIGTPLTSSITKYGRPESVVPASSTLAMFGWSIKASACRSASKRAITCRVSMPGLMIFSATLRWTGCVLLGHEHHAHAPFADLLQQLVGADDRAGALRDQSVWRRHLRGSAAKEVPGLSMGSQQFVESGP